MKLEADRPVPDGDVTDNCPVVAPVGTVVVIVESEAIVNVGWEKLLNNNDVAPVNPEPVIVTAAPNTPGEPVKDVIAGATEAYARPHPL